MGRGRRLPRPPRVGVVAWAAACGVLAAAPALGTQPFACGSLSGSAAATCAALGDVYYGLNGTGWRANTGWAAAAGSAAAPNVCAFYGVTCDANGRVTQLALSRNLLRGQLPASLGNITSLQALFVDSSFLFGTIPASLATLPALRNLSLADNFLVGDVPAGLGALASLSLDKNNLTSATLATPLCAAACASTEAFACPFAAAGCACAAAPTCRGACSVSVAFNSLVGSCSDVNTACVTCTTALLTPYFLAGISAADNAMLGRCITADDPKLLAAGANPAVLDSLRYCQYTALPDAGVTCPVTLPDDVAMRAFSAAAADQCSPSILSTTYAPCALCATTIQQPFLDAGCPEQYDVLTACYSSHLTLLLRAGITTYTLALLTSCPSTLSRKKSDSAAQDVVLGAAVGGTLGGVFLLALVALAVTAQRRRRARAAAAPASPAFVGVYVPHSEARDFSARSSLSMAPGQASLLLRGEDVVLGELIGKGGYAKVHAARWRGSAVAAKVFAQQQPALGAAPSPFDSFVRFRDLNTCSFEEQRTSAAYERELAVLSSLRHPNVCTVYGVVVAPPMLIMELCSGGSLTAMLRASTLQSLPWTRRANIGAGVACGVDFLHSQEPPVIHRDLKSLNVVLSEGGVPKLVDFGLGGFLPHVAGELASDATAKGTPAFMPPELLISLPGGTPQALDIFGVGVVLHDLAHVGIVAPVVASSSSSSSPGETQSAHTPLLSANNRVGRDAMATLLERHTANFAVSVAPHCPAALADILLRCMRLEPASRPLAGEVLLIMLQLEAAAAEAAARHEAWT